MRTLMTFKVLMIIESHTQRAEFISTLDILYRAGIQVDICGEIEILQRGSEQIVGYDNSDLYERLNDESYSAIIFPGGREGVKAVRDNFFNDSRCIDKLISLYNKGILIAAICAAPNFLGEIGILKGNRFTCYPGFEGNHFGGDYSGEEIVVDKNLITGRSMYYSVDFGLEIVKYILGEEMKIKIENQVKGIQ